MNQRQLHLLLFFLLVLGCSRGQQRDSSANQLANESSPYLLQHAHNPVNWHPWGEKALEKATREDKMLVISIGYAACHWCHVMERESFEDTTVARLMNKHFVNIKVDREERPDVDDLYMTACQLSSGGNCGWPLNVFALPDGRPVWTGTYLPKKQWTEVLEYFAEAQKTERAKLERYADQLRKGITNSERLAVGRKKTSELSETQLQDLTQTLLANIDFEKGGQKIPPKFPLPNTYQFLLRRHYQTGDPEVLEAVRATLDGIARGGIFDQLGGGFHRYSTDAEWLVPHFEKMLYDNAQLVSLYAQAYQATENPLYRKTAKKTLDFIRRDMTSPEGGFYSSLDADSEEEEGKYYVWTDAQIDSVLQGPLSRQVVKSVYNVSAKGNWDDGRNILHRDQPLTASAESLNISVELLSRVLDRAPDTLLRARRERVRPGLDDKMLTAWNALMLRGYTDAYRAFGDTAYLGAARRNARFLLEHAVQEDYRLTRNYKDGRAGINAFLDDYAFTIWAFLGLYEVTFEETWLEHARRLADYAIEHFRDEGGGLFYYTSDLDPDLIVRKKKIQDNVLPSGNSELARGLHQLGLYLYDDNYQARARAMLDPIAAQLGEVRSPAYYSNWAQLYMDVLQPPFEVAIVGPQAGALRARMQRNYLPNAVYLGGRNEGSLELLQGKLRGQATYIYVCQNKSCRLPVQEVERAKRQIRAGG